MASGAWTEVFDDVAHGIRGRIRRHRVLFPGDTEVEELLDYLENHLFDLDLDVNTWLRGCGCPRDAQERFVAKLGSLKSYLDEHRIAVAAEAIRKTSAPIGRIARRAGFGVPRTFQRTFERVLGKAPSDLHRPSPDSEAASDTGPDAADPVYGTRLLATYWRRQVTLGLLDVERAAELRRLLRQLYEPLRGVALSRGLVPGRRIGVLRLMTGAEVDDPALAFQPTEAALRYDAQSVPRVLARLLGEIYRHLFKPKLRLDQILEAGFCGKSIWRRFTTTLGQSPWDYIRDARLEMAARMLLLSSLRVGKVGERVGYPGASTFHRLVKELTGLGPKEYRRRARRLLERGGPPPWGFRDAHYWAKAVTGELTLVEAVKLDEYLERLFSARAWDVV